jgi:hypothetical protein
MNILISRTVSRRYSRLFKAATGFPLPQTACDADYNIDGIEVEHPSYEEEGRMHAAQLVAKKKVDGIGCSDAHNVRFFGICRTILKSGQRYCQFV